MRCGLASAINKKTPGPSVTPHTHPPAVEESEEKGKMRGVRQKQFNRTAEERGKQQQ